MNQVLKTIAAIPALIRVALETFRALEEILPVPKIGSAKLAIALAAVESVAEMVGIAIPIARGIVEKVLAVIAALYKSGDLKLPPAPPA